MIPTSFHSDNSLIFLHEMTKNPVFWSDNDNISQRIAVIDGLLGKLNENLDFIVSTSKFFDTTPKRLTKVFKLIGDVIQQDEVQGHELALKCHSMLCKIIAQDPCIIEYSEIPKIIAEAHYDHQVSGGETGVSGLADLGPPSKLDLYRLADTDRAEDVENDFIRLISAIPYPIKENSRDLFETYETLSIAAEKNYPNLGITCLNKLTASQIMTFLSLTYGPVKHFVKKYIVKNLKEMQVEDPDHYQRIMEKMSKFIDTELVANKPWDELTARTAEDILDVAIRLEASEIIEKIYDILKSVQYDDQHLLYKLCTSEQFPPFASQFAMYYTLTKNLYPENFKEVNTILQQMIDQIMLLRMTPSNQFNEKIPPQDPRFLKQLVQAIVDLKYWKVSGSKSPLRPELVYGVLPFTVEDIKQLALLEPQKITIKKQVFSQLKIHKWLPWNREEARFSALRGSSSDTVIVTN